MGISSGNEASGTAAGQGKYMAFCDIPLWFPRAEEVTGETEAKVSPGKPGKESSDKLLETRLP